MNQTLLNAFPNNCSQLLVVASKIVQSLETHPIQYKYYEHDELFQLMKRDVNHGNALYWQELLGRTHLAASASLIRAFRWMQGMAVAKEAGLFLPYCASYRSLIESVADGYDALSRVPPTLSSVRNQVNSLIAGNFNGILVSSELEELMIHFAHARKVNRGENAPESHKAKQPHQYLSTLENSGVPDIYQAYSELCEFIHPAASSVLHLLSPEDKNHWRLNPNTDEELIVELSNMHSGIFEPLIRRAVIPSLLILKLLTYFNFKELHSQWIVDFDMRDLPVWKKYSSEMGIRL